MNGIQLTVAATEVSLDGGTGSLTVSVTNHGGTAQGVLLEAQAPPGADPAASAAGWTTVDRPAREIGPGATEQYAVTFASGPAPAARYAVLLVAHPASAPAAAYVDTGRTVQVTVPHDPAAPPAPRGSLWWLVVLGVVVVVAIVGAAVFLSRHASGGTAGPPPATSSSPATSSAAPDVRCKPGLVYRQARPADHVCVTPASALEAADDNRPEVQQRRLPTPRGGPYGPDTCLSGYVWRDAFDGDHVCVFPETRTQAARENAAQPGNIVP